MLVLSGLQKAINSLDEAIHYSQHLPQGINVEIVRDSVIQRFEYTYELSWKLLQRWIKINISKIFPVVKMFYQELERNND